MSKNRTAQLIYYTIYCSLGLVGCIASLGIFDNISAIRWDFYVHFTNLSNFLCIGVMLAALIQTAKKKEDSYALQIETLKAELDELNEKLEHFKKEDQNFEVHYKKYINKVKKYLDGLIQGAKKDGYVKTFEKVGVGEVW